MEPMATAATNNNNEHMAALGRFAQENTSSQPRKQGGKRAVKENDTRFRKRTPQNYFNNVDPRRAAELRAIAAVEAQLGERLREDCPMLGVVFDGLPFGAFDTYMPSFCIHGAMQTVSLGGDRIFQQHEIKSQKNANVQDPSTGSKYCKSTPSVSFHPDEQEGRGCQEYNFMPVQPTGRPKTDDKLSQSTFYIGASNPFQSLASMGSLVQGNETLTTSAMGPQGKFVTFSESGLLPEIDGCTSHSLPKSKPNLQQDAYSGFSFDNQFAGDETSLQVLQGGGSLMGSENNNLLLEEQAKMEKKRKIEEARITKEVEVHEKRIRREIERQDNARKKRDEQIQKEIERQRREVERALRDRQREEERREKLMEKETKRVERQRLKDESRRQKEVAKLKIASERAIARRLARESMDLIDDERLELLEAAAATQGLPSIYLLDGETLNQLDRYKEFLKKFPPASVKMKLPLAVAAHPWVNSKVHFGNVLMVWKFLSTFPDILGLWPFTLDEFVQAFHDYDPRLLGEVHIALLKTLVKDVEDVAQASSAGLSSNQYAPGFSGGGHPFLVETAFAWGFDICEWQQHLSPQTWPEILRQFALSAGYGPTWTKHTMEADFPCEDEGKEGNDIVNTLRSGLAVANAVSQMQGKGRHRRRKRHRLTPGTVKFAAFHVLSIEGQSGLSILEVADRIQRSGLRDLTTSKTPEASIAAALSRDTKLFERVAPSTYRVKAAYRKDPEDADNIFQTAREKIRLFQNISIEEEDPEKETGFADEVEREEDTDEDVEGDDLEGALAKEDTDPCQRVNLQCGSHTEDKGPFSDDLALKAFHKTNLLKESNTYMRLENTDMNMSEGTEKEPCSLDNKHILSGFPEDMEIDESHIGESWVQGLMEGDYCDLSVEERLNALVALVEVVNEGNTIRVALEERLESASSLKRQLWAEAQLDRRRFKEEQFMRPQLQSDEGCRTETTANLEAEQESLFCEESKADSVLDGISTQAEAGGDLLVVDKALTIQRMCSNQDLFPAQQAGHPGDRSRAQLKAEIGLKAEELYAYRSLPLGFDRRYNRYWQFVTSSSKYDHGFGRIYFESSTDAKWYVIDTKESFDALMASLDTRGIREAQLHGILRKGELVLKEGIEKSTTSNCRPSLTDAGRIHIECGTSQIERERALERYLDFDKWLWSKCMREDSCLNAKRNGIKRSSYLLKSCKICHELYWPRDRHCSHCHVTIESSARVEAKFTQHSLECDKKHRKRSSRLDMPPGSLPSRIQLLKEEILAVEVAIPLEALESSWTDAQRKTWAYKLKLASSCGELLQLMTELEAAVHREWFSHSYETTEELLRVTIDESNAAPANSGGGEPPIIPWVPQTTAAVALRLMNMDAAIYYSQEQKQSRLKTTGSKEPTELVNSGPAIVKIAEETSDEESSSSEEEKSDDVGDAGIQPSGRGRGRGGRPRGRGGRVSSSKSLSVSDTPKVSKGRVKTLAVEVVNGQQVEKEIRGTQGRGGRGQGRRRARGRGRGRGCGRGRGQGRGGHASSTRGRGCGGPGRQSPEVKREPKFVKITISTPQKKRTSRQVSEQDQESDDDSDQGVEWEGKGYEGEHYEGHYEHYTDKGNAIDGSEELEVGSEPEQEEEPMFAYDDDDDGDVGRPYKGGEYMNVGMGEDSADEGDQLEAGFMGGEEDEEGENDEGFQSDASGESERG